MPPSPVPTPAFLPRLLGVAPFRPCPNATFGNPDFAAASARVLILRLSPWRDVASSTPHLFLAQCVRRALPKAFLDFAFLKGRAGPPDPPGECSGACVTRRRRLAQPPLQFVESNGLAFPGIKAFDLVLVSNSFTLEAINLPRLLLDAGLSPWADERPANAPAILLGGSNALAAHGLVRPDGVGMPDAFFFGEAEEALVPFLQAWQRGVGTEKRARLEQAAQGLDGFWVTGAWPKHVVKQAVARNCDQPGAGGGYPLLDGASADTVRLQAAFGCPAFCAFCFEGFERKPYREVPSGALLAQARQLKIASGARCVELDAYTLNSHAEPARLIAGVARLFERVSLKSQRVDILAAQPALAALELAAGKRSFTLGIEGISRRLRAFLNKTITDDEMARVLQDLLARNVREIKLFYLITGQEAAADLAEFGAFARELGQAVSGARRTTRLVFSFGFLVRMPNTPLRYDRLFLEREPLERTARELERMCRRSNFEFRLAASWSEYWITQTLAGGDCRLAPVIAALAQEGFLYDGGPSAAYAQRLQEALAAAGAWDDTLTGEKTAKYRFPFDFVATAVSPKFLWKQFEAARKNRDAGYCLGSSCLVCGACRTAAERKTLTRRTRVPVISDEAVAEVDALTRDKQRLPLLFCRVRLGTAFAQTSAEWTSARLLQLLLARLPEEADNLLAAEEALFAAPGNRERFPIPAGESVVALKAWDAARLAAKLRTLLAADNGCATSENELALLEILPEFAAGQFASATWQVVSAAADADAVEATVVAWLKEAHLPFSLRRTETGAAFELAPAAARKGFVLAASCRREGHVCRTDLILTPKADLLALLRRLPPAEKICCTTVAVKK